MQTRLRASRDDCAGNVERVFHAAIDAGQLPRNTDVHTAVIGLFCYVEGLIYSWLTDPETVRLDTSAEKFVDIYLAGLQQPLPGA
jgi:hypothetical protein